MPFFVWRTDILSFYRSKHHHYQYDMKRFIQMRRFSILKPTLTDRGGMPGGYGNFHSLVKINCHNITDTIVFSLSEICLNICSCIKKLREISKFTKLLL